MIRSIYLNLEDDIPKITARLKRERADEVVLVFPKKSFIFSDSINLRLLKKQADVMGKKVHILTMDEMGQAFAKEAGFTLKFLPNTRPSGGFGDIRSRSSSGRSAMAEAGAAQILPQAQTAPAARPPLTGRKRFAGRAPSASGSVRSSSPAKIRQAKSASRDNFFSSFGIETGQQVEAMRPRRLRDRPFSAAPRAASGISSVLHRRAALGFAALSLIVIVLLVFFILPSADIAIYAKTEPVARDIEISLNTQTNDADSTRLVMPAVAVNQNFDQKNNFNSSGKQEVGSKAEGKVYILNFTGQTLNLKAGTTTLSLGGKQYQFTADQISIKPIINNDADPGKDPNIRSADVVAVKGGSDSNLPAGTRIEIANQVFGSRPQVLYAKTATAITGGNSRFISQITEDDLNNSQTALTQAVVEAVGNNLKQKNLILPDKAFTIINPQFASDKPAGTPTPTFQAEAKGNISGLALDYTLLIKMIRDRIGRTLSASQQLQDVSLDKANYSVKSLDLATGTMAVSVHYESQALSQVDTSDILNRIGGKTKQEASEIILSKTEIDRVDITLSPSWQSTIPRFKQKIKLEIKK